MNEWHIILDIMMWGIAAIVWCFISSAVVWHGINTSRRALHLLKMGWRCVGCDFITGPVMVPPPNPHQSPPRIERQ